MEQTDVVVIGAGVVGLAVARLLARQGLSVIIVEAESAIGTGASSRNSEVIHAGIYYPKGSLKTLTCVRGRELLYEFCRSRGIPHRQVGKLIVATGKADISRLESLELAAVANGVEGVKSISLREVSRVEPELRCVAALASPATGIIDSHAYMMSLLGEAEDAGARLALRTRFTGAHPGESGLKISLDDEKPYLAARWLINCAGLSSPDVASRIEGLNKAFCRKSHYAKGSYFTLRGPSPFSRLVYPIPENGGLGVHLTLDLDGRARFGPDVEWVPAPQFDVDPHRCRSFYPVIRQYWPGLPDDCLVPAYAGVRPKICGPDEPAADFVVEGPAAHGVNGVINLLGIESPGLTASLALAELAGRVLADENP